MDAQISLILLSLLLSISCTCYNAGGTSVPSTDIDPASEVVPTKLAECFSDIGSLNRSHFGEGFIFGSAVSAFQVEGRTEGDGSGQSIWDTYIKKHHDTVFELSNGRRTDFYDRFKEDVALMKDMGLDAFRFSISWSRLLPKGTLVGGVNEKGVQFYHDLIDELLHHNITPFVTLFHFDLPQALEDEYGGFLSSQIVDDFKDYADLCFDKFGDKVKYWITLNEPWSYARYGYAEGQLAPDRCAPWKKPGCRGKEGREPYRVTHNLLLAHATAVQLYRKKYQMRQKGQIGITLVTQWKVPLTNSKEDQEAAERSNDFMLGWYMDPLTTGDYPESMRSILGLRLPRFDKRDSNILKNSFDFIGMNYYTAVYVYNAPTHNNPEDTYSTDSKSNSTWESPDGKLIGVPAPGTVWLYDCPGRFYEFLQYMKEKYGNIVIYITENGIHDHNNHTLPVWEAIDDFHRIEYTHKHLCTLLHAMEKDHVYIRGYFAWSLMDNLEWSIGEKDGYGFYYVDFKRGLARYAKRSVAWFKYFLLQDTNKK